MAFSAAATAKFGIRTVDSAPLSVILVVVLPELGLSVNCENFLWSFPPFL